MFNTSSLYECIFRLFIKYSWDKYEVPIIYTVDLRLSNSSPIGNLYLVKINRLQ